MYQRRSASYPGVADFTPSTCRAPLKIRVTRDLDSLSRLNLKVGDITVTHPCSGARRTTLWIDQWHRRSGWGCEQKSGERIGRDFCSAYPNTPCALLNRVSTGFRGINGDLPASAGPLHLFHDPSPLN